MIEKVKASVGRRLIGTILVGLLVVSGSLVGCSNLCAQTGYHYLIPGEPSGEIAHWLEHRWEMERVDTYVFVGTVNVAPPDGSWTLAVPLVFEFGANQFDCNHDGEPGTILDLTYMIDNIFRVGPW